MKTIIAAAAVLALSATIANAEVPEVARQTEPQRHLADDEQRQLESRGALGAEDSVAVGAGRVVRDSRRPERGGWRADLYLPQAPKQRDRLQKEWPKSDPETFCYLPGVPRATYMPYLFQIVQGETDRDILIAYSYASANCTIYMKDHKDPPVDTWMGRSNGQWEGDTLVVVTTGFNARAHLDRAGNHFSSSLKVTERFMLENSNVIRYEATLEDPETYSKAWTIRMPLYRHVEENAELLEHACILFVEELLYKDLEPPKKETP